MQPPARMNGKGDVIKSMKKNKDKYQDRVENYLDNLLPDSGQALTEPRQRTPSSLGESSVLYAP
jgi:hypothetical protein